MGSFLERYRDGEYEQVWEELLSYGEQVNEKELLTDARAVAQETMLRIRANLELLAARLRDTGYQFRYPSATHLPPLSDVQYQIANLERRAGKIPLSLRAWYEVVGAVNFTGTHPRYPQYFDLAPLPDPLVVRPLDYVLADYVNWQRNRSDGMHFVPIGPDEYSKNDIDIDPDYEVMVPNSAADAPLLNTWHRTTFVNYIRISLRWGGFPGFADPHSRPKGIDGFIKQVTRGLLPV